MGYIPEDAEMATTRRQASVTCDKIEEAIEAGEYAEARDSTEQLAEFVDELQGVEDA